MIKLTDVKGKAWWINPSAIAAVTACDEYGYEIGFQRIETRTYIYMGGMEHVISMAEPPEEVLRMLRGFKKVELSSFPYADESTMAMPHGGRKHQ